jgi:hypothetical protein
MYRSILAVKYLEQKNSRLKKVDTACMYTKDELNLIITHYLDSTVSLINWIEANALTKGSPQGLFPIGNLI